MSWRAALAILVLSWSGPAATGTLLAVCQGAADVDVIDTAKALSRRG